MSTSSGFLTTHKAFKDGFHVTVVTAAADKTIMTAGSNSVKSRNAESTQKQSAVPTICPAVAVATTTSTTATSPQPPPIHKPSEENCPPTPIPTPAKPTPSSSIVVRIGNKNTTPQRPVRPSLSDQLAAIGAQADTLTHHIRKTHGLDAPPRSSVGTPVRTFPAHSFAVGRLECRFPSPVQFFVDRCEYTFHHPFEAVEIRMVMYYRGESASHHTTPHIQTSIHQHTETQHNNGWS